MDILLDKSGDLYVSPQGDIALTESVAQKIRIRLRWFAEEWRWNRKEGLPYFEYLFRKNPDTNSMEAAVRARIFEVPEVTSVRDVSVVFDPRTRIGRIRFTAFTDQETIQEEVELPCPIQSTA